MNKGHLLLFCMAIAFCLNPLYAQTYSGGNGSQSNPYLISNANDLESMASNVTSSSGKYYRLTNDINMQGETFSPIGTSPSRAFKGHFDGNNYTISNITLTGTSSYTAIFGYVYGGSIENLSVVNCSVTTGRVNYISILCAYANSSTLIRNINCNGSLVGGTSVGMICGCSIGSTIENCVTSGSVKALNMNGGGICGYSYGQSTIRGCCNLASVEGVLSGGICGKMGTSNSNKITYLFDCSNFGSLNGTNVGGIVGNDVRLCHIERCFSACLGLSNMGAIIGKKEQSMQASMYFDIYYDNQICTNITTTIGGPESCTTDYLTSGSVFNHANWSEAPGRYPIPAALENNPMAQVAAAAAVLGMNDNVTSVNQFVLLSQANGETWSVTSGNSIAVADANMAYPKATSGASTLTASITSNGKTFTKGIELTANTNCTPNQVSSGQWTPVGNDNAIIAGTVDLGDGQSQSQYTVQNLHISNGAEFTINPATTLIVEGTILCDDVNKLILEDGAQLIHNNNGVKATLKKDIEGYGSDDATDGWYFVSAPVSENPNVSSIMPQEGNYDLYRFNEAEMIWENVKDQTNNFSTLNNGEGFLYANSEGEDISFAGTLMASHAEIPLTNEGSGWNLVGNPFPCDAMVNKPYYVCNGSSVVLSTDNIAPGMGVMVQAEGDDDFVSFTKVLPDQQSSQIVPNILAELRLATRGASLMDNARIGLGEGNQLEKFHFNENSCLYIPQNNKEYAVVNASNQGTLPLCFKAPTNGDYTIHFCINNTEMDYLHLIDNLTGVEVDLLMLDNYTFSAKTTDYASRFKLVFKAKPENEVESSEFAFFSDGDLVIMNEGNATLQIIDMAGRIVKSQTIDGDFRMGTQELNHGVYVLNLEGKSQKIVL